MAKVQSRVCSRNPVNRLLYRKFALELNYSRLYSWQHSRTFGGVPLLRCLGYAKRGDLTKEKMITSSPVTVLMSWCILNAFTPATS